MRAGDPGCDRGGRRGIEVTILRNTSSGECSSTGSRPVRRKNAAAPREMTLHVFTTNERAISLYERQGYSAEWIR